MMIKVNGSGSQTTSVLFIDANDKDRYHYGEHLKIFLPDYCIFESATGHAGLEFFNHTFHTDCVVLEIDLPDMSGYKVLIELVPAASSPTVPVIVLTRLENPMLLELALKNGASAAFFKTTTPPSVLDMAIRTAVSKIPKPVKEATYDIGQREYRPATLV